MVLWLPPAAGLLVGALAALAALVPWLSRHVVRYAPVAVSLVVLGTGVGLVVGDQVVVSGVLRADALSSYLLAVVGAVALVATWGGLAPPAPVPTGADRRYAALVCAFLAAMSLAVLADNLGVVWIAVEATTITTAFLVGHHGTTRALEAAWKYVVLGSVGVAIALLGTVLLYAAARAAGNPTLSWVVLSSGDVPLDPGLVKVAGALAVLGFATKAGLAPMHSWLPDAHSQAPAPVSGLMSGVLLAVAFYAILRVQAVVNPVVGSGLLRGMLLVGGLGSLLVAAALIARQRDYKRLLAYSSIEHMGLMAVGAAVGGRLALVAVLLHVLGHGLTKSVLFLGAGKILDETGTTTIADVRGLLHRRPDLAVIFAIAIIALLGLPPFAPFFSEIGIVLAGWQAGLGWAVAVALFALLVVLAGIVRAVGAMLLGSQPAPSDSPRPWAWLVPTGTALVVVGVVGFFGLGDVLVRAAEVLL
ncbi:MAG: hydrogenase [Micrococcales bacterium]|nr:hydrogenase [Micrococcales bacterium]MCL2666349.1 hydrogenase [Micrococcales bacterium]